jgi:hypothetical protein
LQSAASLCRPGRATEEDDAAGGHHHRSGGPSPSDRARNGRCRGRRDRVGRLRAIRGPDLGGPLRQRSRDLPATA